MRPTCLVFGSKKAIIHQNGAEDQGEKCHGFEAQMKPNWKVTEKLRKLGIPSELSSDNDATSKSKAERHKLHWERGGINKASKFCKSEIEKKWLYIRRSRIRNEIIKFISPKKTTNNWNNQEFVLRMKEVECESRRGAFGIWFWMWMIWMPLFDECWSESANCRRSWLLRIWLCLLRRTVCMRSKNEFATVWNEWSGTNLSKL